MSKELEALVNLVIEAESVNANEKRISFLMNEIEKDLDLLEMLKNNWANFEQISTDRGIEQTTLSFNIPFSELKKVSEWLKK